MMGIYAIRGPHDGVYIGKAIDIKKRWGQHRFELRKGIHGSPHLQYAWNKHGESAFAFLIVEVVNDKNKLTTREQVWLDIMFGTMPKGTVYNHATFSRGGGHTKGRKNNENQRRALIEANKRRVWTPEVCAEFARVRTGLKQSKETVAKRVAKSRGQKRTLEQLTNRVRSFKKGNAKTYTLISPDGAVYRDIVVVGAFASEHNLDRSALFKVLRGRCKHHHGWTIFVQSDQGISLHSLQ